VICSRPSQAPDHSYGGVAFHRFTSRHLLGELEARLTSLAGRSHYGASLRRVYPSRRGPGAGLCSAAPLSSILFGVGGRLGTSTGRLSSPFTRRPPAGSHPALRKPVREGGYRWQTQPPAGPPFTQHAAVFAGPGVRRRTARRGRCLTQPTLRPAAITGIAAAWRNHRQTGIARNPGLSTRGTCAQHAPPGSPHRAARPRRRSGAHAPPGHPGRPVTAVGREGVSALCSVPWRKGVG
jgi:hypothetical protein